MKKLVCITLLSYLSYSALPVSAAAPPATSSEQELAQRTAQLLAVALRGVPASTLAGADSSSMPVAQYQPSPAVESQLADWWALYHAMPHELAKQLARNYLAQGNKPRPSMQDVETFFTSDQSHIFPPGMLELTHSNIHMRNPICMKFWSIKFEGDYAALSQALCTEIQHKLQGQERSFVRLDLGNLNLGNMVPELVSQLIQELHECVRRMHCHLLSLDLHNNGLTTLTPGMFSGLQDLQCLNLNFNKLTALPPGIFNNLQDLQVLYLNKNRLTTLLPGVFDGLQHLLALSLIGNQLTTLEESGIFDGLHDLQEIWLIDNPVTSDDAAIKRLRQRLSIHNIVSTW